MKFHEFVTVLGGMEGLLDDIVASLLEVGFSMDFGEVPWLRERGRVRGYTCFLAVHNNISLA